MVSVIYTPFAVLMIDEEGAMRDQLIRQKALDSRQSFIVQAPAGSGKTELLIQRYLALLNTVDHPEEILAITFTNKAADEMYERIKQALQRADTEAPSETTLNSLAKKVLTRSDILQWNLRNDTSALKIKTIDSFCKYLAESSPLASQLNLQAEVLQGAELDFYYGEAIENILRYEQEEKNTIALKGLLLHLDNQWPSIKALFIALLKQRDQWLPLLSRIQSQPNLRGVLESYLRKNLEQKLQVAYSYFSDEIKDRLTSLINHSFQNLPLKQPWEAFPSPEIESLSMWIDLIDRCLIQEGAWRKQVDKKSGFLPKTKEKQGFIEIVNLLSLEFSNLNEKLDSIRRARDWQYTHDQWKILEHLLQLLPLICAELKLIFQAHNKIDFIEIAQAALEALNLDHMPTDLALRLDYQIKHILVDEFQDTSSIQFKLLECLTAGWEREDGRTLFLVGDPMQSIYRFRGAEVGLFLRAQRYGIGSVPLNSLTLSMNFRSQANLVNWINDKFPAIFPSEEAITENKVKFTPAHSVQEASNGRVRIYFPSEEGSPESFVSDAVIQSIQTAQKNIPQGTLAILGRTRQHLIELLPALRKNNIAYQAHGVEENSKKRVLQDLKSLTLALIYLGDRLSWLSLLRSPCCGLTLSDLHALASPFPMKPILECIEDESIRGTLSLDGQRRILKIYNVLSEILSRQQRLCLANEIRQAWLALQGPATLTDAYELAVAEAYFELLQKWDHQKILLYSKLFITAVEEISVKMGIELGAVQVMTIHGAKGLEFDTVILPYIDKNMQGRPDSDPLLLWLEQPQEKGESHLFLAPIQSKHNKTWDPLYKHLKYQQSCMLEYEEARLFYVAVTRAKQQLYLISGVQEGKAGPSSWLNKLNLRHSADKRIMPFLTATPQASPVHYLTRLTEAYFYDSKKILAAEPIFSSDRLWFYQDPFEKNFGTVAHHLFYRCSQLPNSEWDNLFKDQNYWAQQCLKEKIPRSQLKQALSSLNKIMASVQNSKQAHWILFHGHESAVSEYALSYVKDGKIERRIIDRSFIEDGTRWIIDYKLSEPPAGESQASFLESEQRRYYDQLKSYIEIFEKWNPQVTIQAGLYFPKLDIFHKLLR